MEIVNFTVHGEVASARLPGVMVEVGMVGTVVRNLPRASLFRLFSKVSSTSPPLRTNRPFAQLKKLAENEHRKDL